MKRFVSSAPKQCYRARNYQKADCPKDYLSCRAFKLETKRLELDRSFGLSEESNDRECSQESEWEADNRSEVSYY